MSDINLKSSRIHSRFEKSTRWIKISPNAYTIFNTFIHVFRTTIQFLFKKNITIFIKTQFKYIPIVQYNICFVGNLNKKAAALRMG